MPLEVISLDAIEAIARQYGYWAVFSGVLLENTGLPIPGETMTVVGGFLAGNRELSYPGVMAAATTGAILGDNFGYWLGKWGGLPLLHRVGRFFRVPDDKIEAARLQFSRNAAKAVFLGRFITLLRIFAGPLAGISGMPYGQFLICNSAGAIVWAAAIVSLAFFVGRLVSLEQLILWISQAGLAALGLAVVGIVAVWWLEQRKVRQP
jgi:membrane protein DedA with SNARE-associated domain